MLCALVFPIVTGFTLCAAPPYKYTNKYISTCSVYRYRTKKNYNLIEYMTILTKRIAKASKFWNLIA